MEKPEQDNPAKEAQKRTATSERFNAESGLGLFAELLKVVFLAALIIVPVRTFLFQPFFVQGASMEPNFYDGEYLIVNELGYKETSIGTDDSQLFKVEAFRDLQRDDVVVFRYPKNPEQYFIKRVIGLPGEKVEIKNGKVTIFNKEHPNGLVLDESKYLPSFVDTRGEVIFTLKDREYWVLGDNRAHSSDSRVWGPVSQEHIIGKVLFRAWPISKFKLFTE